MNVLQWILIRLPRSWRLAILKAAAYPEFVVKREWLENGPDGLRVVLIDIDEGERRYRQGMDELMSHWRTNSPFKLNL
jgi:hypothetical protein